MATAQPYLPRVTSASLGSAATRAPGDTLLVNFTLAQGTPASAVAFYFQNGNFGIRVVSTNSPSGGTANMVVGADWPDGTYHMVQISVTDAVGRQIFYNASGDVIFNNAPWLSPAPGPTPNAATLDVTITGGVSTVVAPTIASIARTSADTLTVGSPITFNFTVTPGSSPSWTVALSLYTPDMHLVRQTVVNVTQGTISFPTSAEWMNGTYRIFSLSVYDANSTTSYARADSSHVVLATMDFQLTGGVASVTQPDVTTIGRSSPATVTVGDTVALTFSITPGTSAIASIDFSFSGPGGMTRTISAKNAASGTATTTVTSDWLTGPFALSSVTATDTLGRSITYARNSNVIIGHTLPYSSLDFQVTGALTIPPTFSIQPQGGTVQPGNTMTLSVGVNSVVGVTSYQWYVGQPGDTSAPIAFGNSSQYMPQPPSSTTTYWVRVTTLYGTIDSAGATIAVAYPSNLPTVITQPDPIGRIVNNGGTLSAFVVGPPPLSYQWFKDGAALSGATTASLSFVPGQLNDNGTYVLKITNPNGTTSTNPVSVSFVDTPIILVQPASQTVKVGDTVMFTVTATGGGLNYAWSRNNSGPIPGATINGNTLTIASVQPSNAGNFQVQVANQAGRVLSALAVLTVTGGPPPTVNVASTILATLNHSFSYSVPAAGDNISGYAASGLPPGLVIDAKTGLITGTPTAAGTYPATISATNGGGTTTLNTSFIVSSGVIPPVITRQPVSQTAVLHMSVTFTADATTPADSLSAQWNFNGQPIPGERGSNLTVFVDSAAKAGDYTVDFSDSAGPTRSAIAHLTVDAAHSAPYVNSFGPDQTATAGTTITLPASFGGTAPLTVQWYRYNTAIPGATSVTYTITNASTQDTAQYYATVMNDFGKISTLTQTLIVNYVATPADQSIAAGGTAIISVPASGAVVSYRWYEGKSGDLSKPVAGGNGPTLTTPPLVQSTSYWVWVESADHFAFSSTATVTVTTSTAAPTIVAPPQDQIANAGASTLFTVVPGGTGPFTYQWQINGANISGATNATLALTNVQSANAGSYTVTVSNSAGNVTSNAATLTVNPVVTVPVITIQPISQTTKAGASVVFVVEASGPSLTYQWNINGTPIYGATSPSYIFNAVKVANAGSYAVTVTNAGGSVTSNGAVLAVQATGAPAISLQPQSQIMAAGSTVVLTVNSTGTVTIGSDTGSKLRPEVTGSTSYQWYLDGVALSGGNSATLLVSNVTSANAGSYACLVSNSSGSTLSNAAVVTVTTTTDPGRLTNLSMLTDISAAVPSFTLGTVIGPSGVSGTKPLVVRAVGPSLSLITGSSAGLLPDPKLDLYAGQTIIATNDNWGTPIGTGASSAATVATAMASVGAFAFTGSTSLDAAVYQPSLAPRDYTVIVNGVGGATGLDIAEIYDAASTYTPASPRLINVSVNKPISAGGYLTLGFTISGSTAKTVLIRVIGPSLTIFGYPTSSVLGDPQLTLYNSSNQVIATNNDWGANAQLSTAGAQVGAFSIGTTATKDAMLLITLPAGGYTATATGNGGTGGIAIVEVYEVP